MSTGDIVRCLSASFLGQRPFSAHLDWLQNPVNVMKGINLNLKNDSIQTFTITPNKGWGTHLESTNKATHKCSRVEGNMSSREKVQGPLSKSNSVGCYGQLNSGNIHKQTRRNTFSGDVCSPVENHDLVPSLPDKSKSQAHSRVPECDGRLTILVEPSPINRMVTASAGVQTDLSKVNHSLYRSNCHSPEPQSSIVCISSPRPTCQGDRCSEHNWSGLTAYAYPPMALLHRVIQKSDKAVISSF